MLYVNKIQGKITLKIKTDYSFLNFYSLKQWNYLEALKVK